jgi:hypothetical protein
MSPATPSEEVDFLGRGWLSAEFAITAATTIFAMWVGYRIIVDPELDLQRALAAVGSVMAVAWYYINRRTQLKQTVAEANTTTIKAPGGADLLPLQRLREPGR